MNKIATLFHPKIYGGTMLLTLNSSLEFQRRKTTLNSGTKFGNVKKLHDETTSATHCFYVNY